MVLLFQTYLKLIANNQTLYLLCKTIKIRFTEEISPAKYRQAKYLHQNIVNICILLDHY